MPYDKMLEVRKKHINPGVLTYYKNPLLVNQVGKTAVAVALY